MESTGCEMLTDIVGVAFYLSEQIAQAQPLFAPMPTDLAVSGDAQAVLAMSGDVTGVLDSVATLSSKVNRTIAGSVYQHTLQCVVSMGIKDTLSILNGLKDADLALVLTRSDDSKLVLYPLDNTTSLSLVESVGDMSHTLTVQVDMLSMYGASVCVLTE